MSDHRFRMTVVIDYSTPLLNGLTPAHAASLDERNAKEGRTNVDDFIIISDKTTIRVEAIGPVLDD